MTTDQKISTLVSEQFPQFMQEEGPNFIAFVEAYYEWMEQTGNAVDATKNLLNYRDVDLTTDAYLKYFEDDFLPNVPRSHLAYTPTLLKNVASFYRARGSEKSYELLFRILFDDDVEFYYPGEDILRASDGKWTEEVVISIEGYPGSDAIFDITGESITGGTSIATGVIENVSKIHVGGAPRYTLIISHKIGTFLAGETVTTNTGFTFEVLSQTTNAGYWIGTDGFLSSNKFLQDNYFYQEYSYVLKTNQFVDRYRQTLNNIVHPSGTAMFGQVVSTDVLDFSDSVSTSLSDTPEEITISLPPLSVNTVGFGSNTADEVITILESRQDDAVFVYDTAHYSAIENFDYMPLSAGGNVASNVANNMISFYSSFTVLSRSTRTIGSMGSTTVMTGTGTAFTNDLANNDVILIRDTDAVQADQLFTVKRVVSDTEILLNAMYEGTLATGEVYSRSTSRIDMFNYGAVSNTASVTLQNHGSIASYPTVYKDFGFIT